MNRAPAAGRDLLLETIDVRTTDRWSLRADVLEPAGDPVGVAILAHAAMSRRAAFDRPRGAGRARFLAERGWCAVAFDFRGHGDSTPPHGAMPGSGYDELVARDLPAICDFARHKARERPVVVLGHSLGGHVAMAAVASGAIDVDAAVGLGAVAWVRHLEPSQARWWAKRAFIEAMLALSRRAGRFPARALRMGSDDESRALIEDIARIVRSGRWGSADGRVDYLARLERVRLPILEVVSEGDRFECSPDCARRLAARCGARHEVLCVSEGDDGTRPPDHMGLVTGGQVRTAWARIEAWMRANAVEG